MRENVQARAGGAAPAEGEPLLAVLAPKGHAPKVEEGREGRPL